MDPFVTRALSFWILRVAIAGLLALGLAAWQGPDPLLGWLWVGYALLSAVTTTILIRRGR